MYDDLAQTTTSYCKGIRKVLPMLWYDWRPGGALFSLFVITLLCEVCNMCEKSNHPKNSFNLLTFRRLMSTIVVLPHH